MLTASTVLAILLAPSMSTMLFCSSSVFICPLQLGGHLQCFSIFFSAANPESLFQHTETIRVMNYPFPLLPDITISVTCTTTYLLSSHVPKYSTVAKSGKAATHKSKVLIFHSICHSPLEDPKQTEEAVKECRPHSSGYESANVASYQTS